MTDLFLDNNICNIYIYNKKKLLHMSLHRGTARGVIDTWFDTLRLIAIGVIEE